MRLLTHNMLCCLKCDHFPLNIRADEIEDEAVTNNQQDEEMKDDTNNNNNNNNNENTNSDGSDDEDSDASSEGYVETEEDKLDFVIHMLPSLDWNALVSAAKDLKLEGIPDQKPDNIIQDKNLLRTLNHALNEIKIVNGAFMCSKCGATYAIKNAIANLILKENELKE